MAYVVRTSMGDMGNGATPAIPLPTSLQNDLVSLSAQTDGGSTLTSIVGNNGGTWTQRANAAGGDELWVFTCVQGATPDTEVTITWDGSERTTYTAAVIRGADTTTPVDAVNSSTGSSLTPTAPSVTTTTTNCLILLYTSTGAGEEIFPPEGVYAANNYKESYRSNTAFSYTYHPTADATGTYQFYEAAPSARSAATATLAIRDDGSGNIKGYHDTSSKAFEYIHLMMGSDGIFSDNSIYDPTSVSYENISSMTNGSYTNSNVVLHPNRTTTQDSIAAGYASRSLYTSGSYTNYAMLSGFVITETYGSSDNYDLSSELLIVNASTDNASFKGDSQIGTAFGLSDKTNARFWQLSTPDSVPASNSGLFPSIIDPSDSSFVMSEVGTPNPADVGAIILCSEPTATYSVLRIAPISIMRTMSLQGGSVNFPCSFETAYDIAKYGMLNTVLAQGGLANSQFLVAHHTKCGGSSAVYWDSSNQAIEWPAAYSAADTKRAFKIGAAKITHTIAPVSGSTVIYSSCTLNFANYHNFVLDSAVNISSDGLNVLNATVTLTNHSGVLSGVTFSGCKEIVSSVDLSGGNTISNCVDAQAITVTSEAEFAKLYNCTFKNNTVAIKITGNQTGSWSDPNLTVSGNTYDIEYTGTTDFSIQSANTLTVNNSSTGTLTTVTPTFDLVINSDQTGCQIEVFSTGTQTSIALETSAASLTYTHSSETVDITVLKDGYLPYRETGRVLSGSVTIGVQMIKSREYNSSHGLTYTTDASWSRALNQLTVPTWGVTGQKVFSLILQSFRTQSALKNTAFNMQMDGAGSLFLTNGAEGASDASIENLIECGVAYLDSSDVTTASWVGVKSVGTATGFTGEYQQVDGSGATDARAIGIFNEVIKMYGDLSHGNFDYTNHLVLKYQPNGYREKRVDVLDSYGVSALTPSLYIVAMQPVAITAAVGDPVLTLTITDHGALPVTWNTKNFSITVTADAANTGEDILRELNYNLSLDAIYNGKDPFNWPEMVIEAGSAYETARGITEGGVGATLKGVRVIDGLGNPHPAFTRMQADDGTYYVVPITANISITNLPDDIGGNTRLQIYNVTTATLIYSGDPAGTSYSQSYTDGDLAYASAGDNIRIRFAHVNAGTSFELGQTIVVATTSGITADGDNFITVDDVYATNGLDGSTITKFTYTPVDDQFNLIINSNFLATEMYAFYCYTLTTADGIQGAYGAFVAADAGNYKNITAITSIYLDNETTASKRQTDTARIYRDDGAYPVLEPTTSGFGIDINWQNVVYVVTAGSGLTTGQAAELTAAAEASTVNTKIGVPVSSVSADIAALNDFNPATAVVEGSETWTEAMRLVRANAAGKLSATGTTVTIRDAADTKDRITATVDDDGQRTAVTTDVS